RRHVSYEGGVLQDPWRAPYEDMFQLTVAPERAPDRAEEIEVERAAGVPVAVNGECLAPAALLARLNALAGAHGVGRADVVENRYVGLKSRGVYETPGGTVLRAAFQAVESLTLDREVMHLRDALVPRYAEMVYYGYWFAPERVMLQAAIDEAARAVTGTARLHLYRGSVRVVGRKAPRSLYDPKLVSFDEAGGYRQEDAGGFIRLSGLRLRIQALVERTRQPSAKCPAAARRSRGLDASPHRPPPRPKPSPPPCPSTAASTRTTSPAAWLIRARWCARGFSPGARAPASSAGSRACAASSTPAASAFFAPTRTSTWRSSGG